MMISLEEKKPIEKTKPLNDEALDQVAGGAGGAPPPTAAPMLEQEKPKVVTISKRP